MRDYQDSLKLFFFGSPRVERDGVPVEIGRRKALALLIYLAVGGQAYGRDTLATLFWPDHPQSTARAYLRRDLAVLNAGLEGDWLSADRDVVALKREPELWLDIHEFERLLELCRSHPHPPDVVCPDCLPLLTEAAALYSADFLAGFTLKDSAEFDDWQFFQAESLRQKLAGVLERLVQGLSEQGAYEEALTYARRWLALDPLHEPVQRWLMRLYHQAGQPAAALRQYEEFVKLLEEELGLPPEEETVTLYEAIRARRLLGAVLKAEAPQTPGSATPPPTEQVTPRHNLPLLPTAFIGREKEGQEMGQLLLEEPTCRLLTLVGPGGIGKTRLAVAVATELLESFAHGVFFVSLVPVNTADFIVSTIAEALNLNLQGSQEPKEQLLSYLQAKQVLLLLDNFEHLLEGADLLAGILRQAPGVKLLVTSREILNLQEEWSYTLRGLPFPDPAGPAPAETLQEYGAVRLFFQSAQRARAGFSLTAENIPAVIRICELVDGLPLALELAAPWVRLMSCQEIAAEIERNLDILATSIRNVPERHRSLRGIFEQTWQRLSEAEQVILRLLRS